MSLVRNDDGTWFFKIDNHEQSKTDDFHPTYFEALPRYATALDPAFTLARKKCEFEFLFSLLRVRGLQDAGWDPYETTLRAIPALKKFTARFRSSKQRVIFNSGFMDIFLKHLSLMNC